MSLGEEPELWIVTINTDVTAEERRKDKVWCVAGKEGKPTLSLLYRKNKRSQ